MVLLLINLPVHFTSHGRPKPCTMYAPMVKIHRSEYGKPQPKKLTATGIIRSPWGIEEDERLQEGVDKYGRNWTKVSISVLDKPNFIGATTRAWKD